MKLAIKDLLKEIPDHLDYLPLQKINNAVKKYCDEFIEDYCKSINFYYNYINNENRDHSPEVLNDKYEKLRNSIYRHKCKLSAELNKLNFIYRDYLGVKSGSRKYCIYTLSYKEENILQIIHRKTDFQIFHSENLNNYNNRTKPYFTHAKLMDIVPEIFGMLYHKYNGTVYEFQFTATLFKVIIEYFDLSKCSSTSFNVAISSAYESYLTDFVKPVEVTKERKTRSDKRNYPTLEEYRNLQLAGMKNKQIQRLVALELGVSEIAVRKDMSRKGLTQTKYTTHKNLINN